MHPPKFNTPHFQCIKRHVKINQICLAMLQGGVSNRNIAASSFGTDGFVFLLRYSAGPTTKSLIRHTCRHAYTSFHNYYIKLCVGAACAGFISFLLHFDFTKTLDRAPYRKNACVFESGFLYLFSPLFNFSIGEFGFAFLSVRLPDSSLHHCAL